MRLFILALMFVFLGIGPRANAQDAAPVKLYDLNFDRVEFRHLFGGLGPNTDPLGSVTEFFVNEETLPLIDVNGDYVALFDKKHATIFKSVTNTDFYVCRDPIYAQNTCVVCPDCYMPQHSDLMQKYSNTNIDHVKKKLVYTLSLSATDGPDKPKKGDTITLFHPMPAPQAPFTLTGILDIVGMHPGPVEQYKGIVYIFKSADDPQYYLSPRPTYEPGLPICKDCADKKSDLEKVSTKPTL